MAKPKPPRGSPPAPARPARAVREPAASYDPSLRERIVAQLKGTREQREVVEPIVEYLVSIGWTLGQLQFGRREWFVPKRPSEASKRERGGSFEGFPVDIVLFDSERRHGDPHHVLAIIETKVPDEERGVSQLESYMQLEPHTKVGVWTNNPDPSSIAVFVFREKDGSLIRRRRPLDRFPRPGEPISAKQQRLAFVDLTIPSDTAVKRTMEDLLDRVVSGDPNVTRREQQLDQLCGILLLKLDSDKRSKMAPMDPPSFRLLESPARTGEEIRKDYERLVRKYPDTFTTQQDRELRLSDSTIYQCVERLAPYRLIDVGMNAISLGFQVLRTAALKDKEGQYFTPQPVIEAGVRLMRLTLEDLVIDPACGTGGFLVGVLIEMQRRYPGRELELSRWAQTNIFGIDKDATGVKLTKAIMQIANDGSAHCVRGDSIRTHLWRREFPHLAQPLFADRRFTAVITNPPFGAGLKVSASDARLAGLDIAQAAGGGAYVDLEIGLHFLQRAHQLLTVGGRLGIILPETYFFSSNYDWLFDWLKPRFLPRVVANVPMEAFMGFCRAKTNFYVFEKIA